MQEQIDSDAKTSQELNAIGKDIAKLIKDKNKLILDANKKSEALSNALQQITEF